MSLKETKHCEGAMWIDVGGNRQGLPAVGETVRSDAITAHVTGCLRDTDTLGKFQRQTSNYAMIDRKDIYNEGF